MTYNTTAIAITPSLLLQRRSEVAAPAISAKDRIAMSAEATRHLAVSACVARRTFPIEVRAFATAATPASWAAPALLHRSERPPIHGGPSTPAMGVRYCGVPSIAKERNFAYLSPTCRNFLYSGSLRHACSFSMLSQTWTTARLGAWPSNAVICFALAPEVPPMARNLPPCD
jgi:hypothetical protein